MTIRIKTIDRGIRLKLTTYSSAIHDLEGAMWTETSVTNRLKIFVDSAKREVITNDQVQVLTNKTIDFSANTISNIILSQFAANVVDTDVALTANSDLRLVTQKATKTYADTVSGNVQTNLTNHINDITDAHDASAISYDNTTSLLTAINTQTAIDEVDTNLDNHISTLSAHGFISGTAPLLASQTNTNLVDLSATKATRILAYVVVDSTFETFDLLTVKRAVDYKITTLSVGDATGITFEITAGGFLTYSSGVLTTASIKYHIETIL